ncbi:hypothetical protein JXA63_01865 [Candidatus Woesebacteria bacterium]|nr:hypothetical protein [Candidatus Woesebacteria bacterium]
MKNISLHKKFYIYLALIAVCIPAVTPLIRSGFYEPHDLHHLADIYQMYRAITLGQLPPRLGPDFLYNFGYPLFNFYYPLPFYVGALFFALGFKLTASYKLVFLVTVIISIIGMYKFLRLNFSKWASVSGSALFLYTPYRAVQIYVRGAMGEALALAILPWVLWMIVKIVRNKDTKNVAVGSIFIFLFLIAHNYLWFISLPVILTLLLFEKYSNGSKLAKGWQKRLILSSFLGFLISSYWLIPAILERKYIDRLTPFLLEDHFPFIKQLIVPSWGYGSSVWGAGDEISFQIGIVNLLIVLLGVIFLVKTKNKQNKTTSIGFWAFLGFLFTIFMMNIRSLPVWKLIPFYNFIQFPWRLLILTTLFTSVLAAFIIDMMNKKSRSLTTAILIILSVVLTFNYFKPNKIVHKTDNDYMSRMFATERIGKNASEVSDEHKNWSEDYLLLPNWSEEKPNELPIDVAEILKGDGSLNTKKVSDTKYEVNTLLNAPSDINFNKLYFPGWYVYVDGEKYKTEPSKPIGSIKITDVPRGQHSIKLVWKETRLRLAFDILSISSLLIAFLLFYKGDEDKKIKSFFAT